MPFSRPQQPTARRVCLLRLQGIVQLNSSTTISSLIANRRFIKEITWGSKIIGNCGVFMICNTAQIVFWRYCEAIRTKLGFDNVGVHGTVGLRVL